MKVQRESFYRCVYSSPSVERVGHVCAWDAREAVQLFSTELRSEGVGERGTIRVTPLASDGSDRTSAYRP
jgi:hypothetical protein